MGTNAAASRSTSHPAAFAIATRSSGCRTPEKFDWAGKANKPGDAAVCEERAVTAASRSIRRSGATTGSRVTGAPARLANSLMPLTELWLSCVIRKRRRGSKG